MSSTSTHPPVALGLPGADHDVAVAGAGPPVDGADVVAADVLAQRVELGALAAHPHRRPAVEVAQPGQPAEAGACGTRTAAATRTAPGHLAGALPGGQAERAEAAHGDPGGAQVAAAVGRQRRAQQHPVAGARGRSRCRLPVAPAVGCQASRSTPADPPARRCWRRRASVDVGWPSRTGPTGRRVTVEQRRAAARAARRRRPAAATASSHSHTVPRGRAQHAPRTHARAAAAAGRRPVSIVHRQRGTGTEPSARCEHLADRRRPRARPRAAARAGAPGCAWASALTSSGVTKSRPVSQAQARAGAQQRGGAARADPEAQRRRLAGGAGDVDDVRRPPRARPAPRVRRPRPAAMSAAPATARDARRRRRRAGRSRRRAGAGSPAPRPRSGTGSTTLSRNRSSWASGSG